jgi:hypothetical protein
MSVFLGEAVWPVMGMNVGHCVVFLDVVGCRTEFGSGYFREEQGHPVVFGAGWGAVCVTELYASISVCVCHCVGPHSGGVLHGLHVTMSRHCRQLCPRSPHWPGSTPEGGEQPGQGPGVRDCSGPREVVQIDQFLKETAAREASAKLRLQQFIEELLERADRAERQLQVISSSCGSTPSASLGRGGGGSGPGPGARGPGRMVSAQLPSLFLYKLMWPPQPSLTHGLRFPRML